MGIGALAHGCGSSTLLVAETVLWIAAITGTVKDALVAWLGSASNGIHDLYAGIIHSQEDHTQKLCVAKSDGSEFCVNGDQLAALAAAGASTAPSGGSTGAPAALSASADAGSATNTTSATLIVNGNNPATWPLNQQWNDNLGALFTHDGQSETIYSTSTVDVSSAGTTTIDYWAVIPSSQQVLHATRAVVIPSAANDNAPIPPLASTGTDASSTAQ
jgi:hypothetical protein